MVNLSDQVHLKYIYIIIENKTTFFHNNENF
jgi:hypothetical protein